MPAKEAGEEAGDHFHTISTVENPAAVPVINDEASKDSLKEDPKEWINYEDDMFDMEGFDEPDPDSDYDYEESYRKKKKRNSKPSRGSSSTDSPHNKKAKQTVSRGRQKKTPTVYPDPSDPEKPFGCDKSSPKKSKGVTGNKSTPSSAGHSRPTTPAGEDTDAMPERKSGLLGEVRVRCA